MKLMPLEDRILVRRHSIKVKSAGGIVLPEIGRKSQVKCFEGTVLAVGPGRHYNGKRVPVEVEVGDKIIFSKFDGAEIKSSDDDLVMLHENDVLARISKDTVCNY